MVKMLIAAAMFLASLSGCGGKRPEKRDQLIKLLKVPIDREGAITIARDHLRNAGHPRSEDRVEAEKQMDDESVWWVTFSSEPPVPGGHTVVKVKTDGTVIDILPGE